MGRGKAGPGGGAKQGKARWWGEARQGPADTADWPDAGGGILRARGHVPTAGDKLRVRGPFRTAGDTLYARGPFHTTGDILRVRGHFLPAGDVSRVRGPYSCPRRRRMPPPGRTRTRPRGMSPSLSQESAGVGRSAALGAALTDHAGLRRPL